MSEENVVAVLLAHPTLVVVEGRAYVQAIDVTDWIAGQVATCREMRRDERETAAQVIEIIAMAIDLAPRVALA
jgi:hypothetical protein